MRKTFPLKSFLLRTCLLFCLGWLACAVQAASIAAPDTWRRESFPFPLAFAASIPYEGTEHVRFTPGWSDFASEQGFGYVFMWDIKPVPMEAAHLERGLAVYFDGLMENVARGRKLDELPVISAVVLHPLRAPAGWNEAYAGAVHTWNAFSKGEELRLHIEIAHRPCPGDRMQIFFAASKAKRTDPAWEPLRKARADTAC
jgi:hypothetical protein